MASPSSPAGRAVLNVAMLLRDSEVARSVRRYLLDTEADRVTASGCCCSRLVEQVSERFHDRVSEVERRLSDCEGMVHADRALLGAMSARLCQVGEDVRELRLDMAELRGGLARLGERRPRRR
ncbi:hypothetical protein [Kitasatospora sp. HPMI-4]|uniref:hypothetical protein n=1 Tax=Kitasatospora sp. HPMI-4 TaxID=3448443 RepID=UPI003F1E39AA